MNRAKAAGGPRRTPAKGGERNRLNAILDSMDDGIYIVGRDYRIEFMNRALQRDFGSGVGCLCHDFFGHQRGDCDQCQHGIGAFGPELRREWFSETARRSYEILVSPIHEPDGSISRLHILRDITERKALEAELKQYSAQLEAKVSEQSEELLRGRRLALLGEIAAGLAHEIRTPLGAFTTGLKLLEKADRPPAERQMVVDLLRREVRRLETKLSEFLSYARPRRPRLRPCSVAALLEEVRTVLATDRDRLGRTKLAVKVGPGLDAWPLDRDQIKEVLLNLGVNALQALGGNGRLELEASRRQDLLEVLVRDNGPGIPPDALPHIFQPFFSRKAGGTGLGLAIARDRVEAHGGRILVTSIAGWQTVFRILLPYRTPDQGATAPTGAPSADSRSA